MITRPEQFLGHQVAGPLLALAIVALIAGLSGGFEQPPGPGLVVGGAVVFAVVPSLVHRLAERRLRSPVASFAVRVATGEEPSLKSGDPMVVLERTAQLLREVVGVSFVALISEAGTVRSGSAPGSVDRYPVLFRGDQIGWIEASRGDGDPPDSEDLASVLPWTGLILDSVVAVKTLQGDIAEAESELRRVQQGRRRLVRTEAARRRSIADGIVSGLEPCFDRTRAAIETGDLDEAAHQAEVLVEQLRSVSTSLRGL